MDNETKQALTRRITTSNRSELIVVLYDIFFAYVDDAKKILDSDKPDDTGVRDAVRHASAVLCHLKDDLDFKYEISANLFSIYDFCDRKLAESLYKGNSEGVRQAEKLMKSLYESFVEVAKQDKSAPLMKNAQKLSAGYTYGRTDVNETIFVSPSRGFFA